MVREIDYNVVLHVPDVSDERKLDALGCPVMVMITGKGPQMGAFENAVIESRRRNVAVALVCLPITEYPALLAKVYLGICLHAGRRRLTWAFDYMPDRPGWICQ